MIITVVSFQAYGKTCTEAFVDKTYQEIHKALHTICSTYVPMSISATDGPFEFQALACLTDYQS
jgi:hypothetical protein